jgi:hypothetical protein
MINPLRLLATAKLVGSMVSIFLPLRLIERLKDHKMIELMRINGKKLGESNLGNKIRWGKTQ